ncbi:MAG: tryptophan--tRNA ligase [Candidatus Harrisonbacteria bacterium RIFCSPLOWO2_02_FULL_41_13b]|uniref:Tryptophan--tRNA ligase n=1 Tax=Candidatus Harrisonbacteria bacterium RIFCSPLOWO2_02_FULL_41_13b TaxID=1798409 RepID=A0A1G1ZST7_9BACT|nr:MAG: tryptophan--tRNA ligase [Candidatus Harrisonbacteria bacterium RIFCSPHIGHO2_02_FULL_40_20]OGY67803.1 MAG: tryptophan--tRNA ligase [Candidatus Harrisonbacteria bacterium RIFCSPLOWO2_02_FULL_41_13b]
MAKPILISGIQPTGRLHLGNYLGALKNFVELQNSGKYQCLFFVADYHSLTQDIAHIGKNVEDLIISYLAAGLNPKKSLIFVQSAIPHSSELGWILSTKTPLSEMERMTQFKDKRAQQKENINTGLLTYPTLMAADILIFNTQVVPVGEDQLQHLELTREIARRFNKKYGVTFVEPKALMSKIPRLMSLDDPTKKMSKSLPNGCLFIDDSPETIREKIKRAVTDSGSEIKYDEANKPAVSNLMLIYSELSGKNLNEIEKKFSGKQYSDFKNDLTNTIIEYFRPFNERKTKLLKEKTKIAKIVTAGNKKALAIAKKKIEEVKQKIFAL